MKKRGFTLIEMMITIAISAILLSLAVPSFQDLIIKNRIGTEANDLVVDLALARSEALKRGARVSVCTSTNGTSCTASSWTAGRLVFTDTGTAGALDGTDAILRVAGALSGGTSLASSPAAIANYIQYLPTGEVASNGSLTLCKSGFTGRIISIGKTGRVSSQDSSTTCP